jgi:hypothetical protein
MPILNQWEFCLTSDEVLRSQGADSQVIKVRRPSLIKITENAIATGSPLLEPQVLYEQFSVKQFVHERLVLDVSHGNSKKPYLSGPLISQHLARAQSVIIMVCTIGSLLDEMVSSLFKVDPTLAIALDGVGSAAVESLAIQACNYFEDMAKTAGLNTTMPLNPGMIGWPLEQGQLEIFTLLESEAIQVTLNESCMMTPNKSLSLVLGLGVDVSAVGTSCDYCSLKGVCKYQQHYVN